MDCNYCSARILQYFFLSETHDGVQDMACDTFIKIAQKCRRHFVQARVWCSFLVVVHKLHVFQIELNLPCLILCQVQVGEVMPFIEEILNSTQSIICDLQPQQVALILFKRLFELYSFKFRDIHCWTNSFKSLYRKILNWYKYLYTVQGCELHSVDPPISNQQEVVTFKSLQELRPP